MAPPDRYKVILAFGLLYFFWGSTYLAIAVAVRHIPPELMTGTRFFIAGVFMLAWCAWDGRQVAISWKEAARLASAGVLLLSVGNTVISWAEQYVPTGLAALLVGIIPLWFLLIETVILRGDRLTSRGIWGLVLGAAGIVVLLWPQLNASLDLGRKELWASLSLLLASLSWAAGSVLSKRWPVRVGPFATSGWQMFFAGFLNLCLAALLGDFSSARWTAEGVYSVAYLVVFGSWVGYSAYIWLLHNVPTPKVATYAYVNPVVAVFLGWLILRERVDIYILSGSAIVICAVALTTTAKVRSKPEHVPVKSDLQALEGQE